MPEIHITEKEVWQTLLRMKRRGRDVGALIAQLEEKLANLPAERLYPTRSGLFALSVQDVVFRIRKMEGKEVYHVIHMAPRF